MANETQQRFYQLPSGMWVDAMTGQRAPELIYLKEAMISAASPKAQAQAAQVEKRYPEQYTAWLYDEKNLSLPKISDYSTFLNTVNEAGDVLARPSNRISSLPKEGEKGGGTIDFIESVFPTSYWGNAMQDASKGNTRNAIGNILLGGASALSGPVAGKVTKLAQFLPFLGEAPATASTAVKVAKKFIPWLLGNTVEAKTFGEAEDIILNRPPSTPVYPYPARPASPATRNMSMTAEEYAKMVAANQNRTDAGGRSGMGATSAPVRPEFGTFEPPVPVSPSAPIATIPPPAQLPLTPEQMDYYGEEMSGINKLYQQTLADIAKDQEQGQLGYARIGQAAQRQAAGAAVDIGNQMAGSGIGSSPAAAFGAEQMVQAPLVQKRQANRLNLDQLLGQLEKQKTQAGTTMDMSKLGLKRWETMQKAANTAGQVQSGYQNYWGGI